MRKGREGLAGVVREILERNPHNYNEAFIFYSKDLRKVKILHYDLNGFVIYEKWFDDGRFLSPYFREARRCHRISRELLILLLSTSVQTRIAVGEVAACYLWFMVHGEGAHTVHGSWFMITSNQYGIREEGI